MNGAPRPGGRRPTTDLPGSEAALLVPREVPDVRAIDRWRSSQRLHALVPTALALRLTDLVYGGATRARPDRLEAARVGVRAVTPPGTGEATITRLATAAVAAQARAWELYHRPRDLAALPVDGLENLVAARDEGRGVLVSYVHYGPELAWLVLRPHLPIVAVLGDWIAEPPPPGYRGLQVEHRRSLLVTAGVGAVHAGSPGSATVQVRALQAGGALLTAFDLPGRRPTRYLARTVGLVDSTARMSMMTGAPVLPGTAVPHGTSWRLQLHAPLRPTTFSSAAQLHQALADVHGDAVAPAPAHYISPIREGMWSRADDAAWYR